jgi:GT2 family glycosyltransferase
MTTASPLDDQGDVSVVIVAYRTPEALDECLSSFEQHRPRRVGEVIVVDNSAQPNGEPPTRRFPWIRYERNATNVHFRRGINQGARLASLPYLMLLNPDTRLLDGEAIAQLADVLDERTDVGLVGPRLPGADGRDAPQGEPRAGVGYLLLHKLYVQSFWPGNPLSRRLTHHADAGGIVDTVNGSAVICRRDDFLAVGGLDERATAYWEEQELARKVSSAGLSAFYLPDAALYHAWRQGGTDLHPESVSQSYFEQSMRLYYEQFYGGPGRVLFDVLTAVQRAVRLARRR